MASFPLQKINSKQRDWLQPVLGLVLLAAALYVGYLFRYRGVFPEDEGDKLAIGLLMARGSRLYRDVFTHHMPFPYLWTAAVLLVSPTVSAVRTSVLFYQVLAFGVIMKVSRRYLATGLAALTWAGVGNLFFANMALYNVFSGAALIVVFAITIQALLVEETPSLFARIAWGTAAGAAILSDPLAALPVLVCLAALWLNQQTRHKLVIPLASAASVFGLCFLYLLLTGSLSGFYNEVFIFNTQVYNHYYQSEVSQLLNLPRLFVSGLGIFQSHLWNLPGFLIDVPAAPHRVDVWAGWIVYRLGVVAISIDLLLRRRWLAAATIYFFATATLLRSDGFFRQIPFVLTSIVCAFWFLVGWRGDGQQPGDRSDLVSAPELSRADINQKKWYPFYAGLRVAMQLILAVTFGYLVVNTLLYYQANKKLVYADAFGSYISVGKEIRGLACDQPAELGFYPGDPMIYFTSGLRPVEGYVYLWPWVYQAGGQAIINRLGTGEEKAIVYINKDREVWGYASRIYMSDLIAFLDANYLQVGPYYVSPSLASVCPSVLTGALTK